MDEDFEMIAIDPVSLVTEEDLKMSNIFDGIYTAARLSNNLQVIVMLDKLSDGRVNGNETMIQLEQILNLISGSE